MVARLLVRCLILALFSAHAPRFRGQDTVFHALTSSARRTRYTVPGIPGIPSFNECRQADLQPIDAIQEATEPGRRFGQTRCVIRLDVDGAKDRLGAKNTLSQGDVIGMKPFHARRHPSRRASRANALWKAT